MFHSFTLNIIVFFISDSLNAMLSQLYSVALTTYIGVRRIVTEEVVFVLADFLRNHSSLNGLVNFYENRRYITELIHLRHKSEMLFGLCSYRNA